MILRKLYTKTRLLLLTTKYYTYYLIKNMKTKTLAIISLLALITFSCNNEDNLLLKPDVQQNNDFELVSLKDFVDTNLTLRSATTENQLILRFKDEAAYERTVEKLHEMSEEERLRWSTTLEGFNSLQEIFNQAMIDIDDVDETEASYMAFKEKYDQYLYFPMYKEDMGFYMPVVEQEKAAFVNSNGLVIIGNEVKSLKNITCYADLQKTGQAYYSPDEEVSTRAIISGVDSKTGSDFIGKEIDSGWFHDKDNDRKLRFKFGRKSNGKLINPTNTSPGFQFKMHLKLEISFRKKTWIGWVNYSSKTVTTMIFRGSDNIPITKSHTEDGASSHDWKDSQSLTWGSTSDRLSNGAPVFYTQPISAEFKTDYRAFDGVDGTSIIKWNCYLPGATFVES